jgi:hypothetical protein
MKSSKETYETPSLTVIGTIVEITRAGGQGGTDFQGAGPFYFS